MIILVDFENTHVSGLDGYEYLNDSDTLVMYYSDENSAVTKGMVTDLKKRNVHVSLVKLLKQHSNALDMYIASTTGMFLESGEKICIVSKDKGYAAVRDFWHSLRGAEILLGETIKECFLSSEKNDDERISLCKERAQKATLVDSFATMNTIPTRPTLSRGNQRRRNRNIHFTEVSEPASLIPNPLMFETPADQLVKQMKDMPFGRVPETHYAETRFSQDREIVKLENSGETRREPAKEQSAKSNGFSGSSEESGSQDRPRREDRRREGSRRQGDRDRNRQGRDSENSRYANSRKDTMRAEDSGSDNIPKDIPKSEDPSSGKPYQENTKKDTVKNPIVKSEPDKTAIIIRPEQKTAVAKSEPKYDPNRVQFVYDPVSRSMKKVGADTTSEKSKADNAEKADAVSKDTDKTETLEAKDTKDTKDTVSRTEEQDAAAQAQNTDETSQEAIDTSEAHAVSPGQVTDDIATTVTSGDKAIVEKAETITAESSESEAAKKEDIVSVDAATKTDDETASASKKTARKSAARKSASKRRTAGKKAAKEAEAASEATGAEAEALTASIEATELSGDKAAEDSSTEEEEKKADARASEKKKTVKKSSSRTKKADAGSEEEAKPKKSRSGRKSKASESADSGSDDAGEQPKTAPSVSPQDAVEKYGLTANTLHTYYVRLVKAYGKEEGRAVYDASKKTVQEEIKNRKAAEKAAEKEVNE